MTIDQLEGNWEIFKGKLKQRYGQLTDDDLTLVEGKGEELLGHLQQKLGISREELNSALDDLGAAGSGRLEEAKAKVAEISGDVRTTAAEVVEDWKQRVNAVGEDAKAHGEAAYEEVRQRAQGLWDEGEVYVRANPLQAVLTALVAGFVAGAIFTRR